MFENLINKILSELAGFIISYLNLMSQLMSVIV